MNNCFLWLVVCCGLSTPLWAQDHTAGQARTPAKAAVKAAGTNEVLIIDSDSLEYAPTNGLAIFTGHVHVDDAEMTIDCEVLTVTFARTGARASSGTGAAVSPGGLSAVAGGKIDTIVAERKVVIVNRNDGMRATGTKAVYSASTDIVELTGDPVVQQPQGILEADVVILDRASNRLLARGRESKPVRMQLNPDAMKREKAPASKAGPAKSQP